MPSTSSTAEPSLWPVASPPIAAQAYSRRARRLSPSLANRLRIGFAIAFALLTAVTVIGVGRLIVQRQDYENSIERSYQREIAARTQLAEGTRPAATRATIRREEVNRAQLRDSISGDTRDTVILVGVGLIAGLL